MRTSDGPGRCATVRRLLVATVTVVLVSGCGRGGSQSQGEGPGGRSQTLALTPEQELALGRQAYQEVIKEYRDRLLPETSPEVRRVRQVVARLERTLKIEPLQQEINLRLSGYRFEWEANVIRDRQANAFCLPAGKIFVFTGILSVVGQNDDFLATVLSHEIAHALAHHSNERVAEEKTSSNPLRRLSHGRQQESEADHIGLFLMTFAGYDPEKAADFWLEMHQARGDGREVPEFFSDHPSDRNRLVALRKWAPQARAAKKAFDEGRIVQPHAASGMQLVSERRRKT